MNLEELLNEEYFDIMCEASIHTLNKRKNKKINNKRTEIDPDTRLEITNKAKRNNGYHKDFDWEDGNPKFRSGRERLVAAVVHLVQKNGGNVSNADVRDYIYERYQQWGSNDPEAKWINALEKKAISLGFNPRSYRNQKKNQSKGKGAKGQSEYDGRAAFYTGLMNGFANHFLSKQGLKLKIRFPGSTSVKNKNKNKKQEEK